MTIGGHLSRQVEEHVIEVVAFILSLDLGGVSGARFQILQDDPESYLKMARRWSDAVVGTKRLRGIP